MYCYNGNNNNNNNVYIGVNKRRSWCYRRRCCGARTRFRKRPVWCADGETDAFLFRLLRHHHSGRSTRRYYYYFRPFGQHNTYTRARTRLQSRTRTHTHTHARARTRKEAHAHAHLKTDSEPVRWKYALACVVCVCVTRRRTTRRRLVGVGRGCGRWRGKCGKKQKRGPNSTHERARARPSTPGSLLLRPVACVRKIRHNGFVRPNGCWGRASAQAAVSVPTLATVSRGAVFRL